MEPEPSSPSIPSSSSDTTTVDGAQSTATSPSTASTSMASSSPAPVPPRPATASLNPPTPRAVSALSRGTGATRIPPSLQAKMAAMAKRTNQLNGSVSPSTGELHHPMLRTSQSAPENPMSPLTAGTARMHLGVGSPGPSSGMAKRKRPGVLSDILGPNGGNTTMSDAGLGAGVPRDEDAEMRAMHPSRRNPPGSISSPFSNFNKIVDPSGALKFGGKAVLHASGVDFSNGSSFAINMTQMQLLEELGRGNYGTVKKVLHKPTNVLMAMKEIRLELDDAKLSAILMELDILHRAVSNEIVEFYGAFFIESCVYYCMEYMDAGSLDKLQGAGVPEHVLARITHSMVRGLKFLKDELQIIHRDVKPTNVLVNKRGDIKLCDFGVSGQLEKSLAKTNIGCQSYMAPERIKGESQNNLGTYTVSSDVWSLGLSMIEIALGQYPYPPETYQNVFAQLTAIVNGPPPELPPGHSEKAIDFVGRCLVKEPQGRATYAELLEHPFLVEDRNREVDMVGWVAAAVAHREAQRSSASSTGSGSPSDSASPASSGGASPDQ